MISEFEFYHGAALARVLHGGKRSITLAPFTPLDNAAYVVNGDTGLYIKYSSKRLSPWRFSFQKRHCELIAKMGRDLGRAVVALVCHEDGIVALDIDEFRQVVGCDSDGVQWVSAARSRRQMYLVKGSAGELAFKVGQDDLLVKLSATDQIRLGATGA